MEALRKKQRKNFLQARKKTSCDVITSKVDGAEQELVGGGSAILLSYTLPSYLSDYASGFASCLVAMATQHTKHRPSTQPK